MKIAIIGRIENYESEKPFNERYYISNYFKEIFDKLDVLLIPIISLSHLDEICNICDGLIVTGSYNDVYPEYYGEKKLEKKEYKYDEFPLSKKAVELFSNYNKPILGICAGIQEINVIFGGTLNQLIDNHRLIDGSKHSIKIAKDSLLYEIYKEETIEINSYHKQSVNVVAPDFKVTAVSNDGIIEAIESGNIIAVQWHPEVLYDMKIFEKFIDMCKE